MRTQEIKKRLELLSASIEDLITQIEKDEQKCVIIGSEIKFRQVFPEKEIIETCLSIWKTAEGDDPWNDFLKYLWVVYSDGREVRLADVVKENWRD